MFIGFILPIITLFVVIITTTCSRDVSMEAADSKSKIEIHEENWMNIADKRIFFGHQSVGKNIIDGINDLQKQCNSNVIVFLETKNRSDFNHPLFAHSQIGNNLNPKSKIADFVNIVDNGLGNYVDIVFMKLGYVDINKATDINELFEYYKTSVSSLQKKYSSIKIVHFTVPLTTKPDGLEGFVKKILKMDNNVYRNKYNELIRNHYEPYEIFDIAEIQSTFKDGTTFRYRKNIPGMISDYSSDGGHLSQLGSQIVAHKLIVKLNTIQNK